MLSLTAEPRVVAREITLPDGGVDWDWKLTPDEQAVLRLMQQTGAAGTMLWRLDKQCLLLAWDAAAQKAEAERRAAKRKAERAQRLRQSPNRIYRQSARPVGMPTHVPYWGEPARWLE